jgi:hypothetical protein
MTIESSGYIPFACRLLDIYGEPVQGYPVQVYVTVNPEPAGNSILNVYDPFTGIMAGPTQSLHKLTCLSDNDGWVRGYIEPLASSHVEMTGNLVTTGEFNGTYRLAGYPYPQVGVINNVTSSWFVPDSVHIESTGEVISRVPTQIGGFFRFPLAKDANPLSIKVTSKGGIALEPWEVVGPELGVTFTAPDLPHGFYIYEPGSHSLLVSDSAVYELDVQYDVAFFKIGSDPRELVNVSDKTGWPTDASVYPDVKLYLHAEWRDPSASGMIKRDTAELVMVNPLSKMEMQKRYAEG